MFSGDLVGWDGGEVGWRSKREGVHIHTHIANSLCYTTLESNYTPVKKKQNNTCTQNKYNFHETLKMS